MVRCMCSVKFDSVFTVEYGNRLQSNTTKEYVEKRRLLGFDYHLRRINNKRVSGLVNVQSWRFVEG